jgi:hypothetical protein
VAAVLAVERERLWQQRTHALHTLLLRCVFEGWVLVRGGCAVAHMGVCL